MPTAPPLLQRTPLFERHLAAGGRLVEFAGWEMPVQYQGVVAEHLAVRDACGVFDVSHMGEIETSGPQALELLQRLLSNDVAAIGFDEGTREGVAQYSLLCREDGGVLDDLITYRLGPERFLTVTNASNHERDLQWFQEQARAFEGAQVSDAPPPSRCWPSRARRPRDRRRAQRRAAAGPHAGRRAHRRRRARAGVRNRLHRRGRGRADVRAAGRGRVVGRAAGGAAPGRRGSVPATRCGSRPACRCTATS